MSGVSFHKLMCQIDYLFYELPVFKNSLRNLNFNSIKLFITFFILTFFLSYDLRKKIHNMGTYSMLLHFNMGKDDCWNLLIVQISISVSFYCFEQFAMLSVIILKVHIFHAIFHTCFHSYMFFMFSHKHTW